MIEKRLRTILIAVLLSHGMTQEAIAAYLGIALGTVRKAIREAIKRGILSEKSYPLSVTFEEYQEVAPYLTDYDLSRRLMDKLEPCGVKTVYVVAAGSGPRETGRHVARSAAVLFRTALRLCEKGPITVALAWGRRLRAMIDATHLPRRGLDNLTLVPLNGALSIKPGEPLYGQAVRCASNRLIQDVALKLGLESHQWWQFPWPGFLPRALLKRPELLKAMRAGIALDPTYQAIYGPHGLMDDVCTVFSACSGLEKFAACVEFGAFDPRQVEILRQRGIVGDWNGHLVPNASDEARALAEELNQLALGASPADMAQVAERAREKDFRGLGVVLVVSGVCRAEVVLAACQMRAVNQLVIATDTARAMLEPPSTYLSAA